MKYEDGQYYWAQDKAKSFPRFITKCAVHGIVAYFENDHASVFLAKHNIEGAVNPVPLSILREKGFYKVKIAFPGCNAYWAVAEYDDIWTMCGDDGHINEELFLEIGDKIELPE